MRPELEVEDLEKKIPGVSAENRAFRDGDHWQNGNGWSGPLPAIGHPSRTAALTEIERIFTSKDILKEIRKRERWALTGNAWTWSITDEAGEPLDEQTAQELRAYLERWMEDKKIVATVGQAIEDSSWAGEDGENGRGVLRFFIPQQRLEEGQAKAEDLGQAMMLIDLEAPEPETATVFEDADSGYERVGFVSWTEEYQGEEVERAELVYVNEAGLTVIENLVDSELASAGGVEVPLLGNITMYQIERPLIVDASMRSLQKFYNHVNTAFQAAIAGAAWPEDFFIGVLPPGSWQDDGSGGEIYVPDPMVRGPGRAHFLQPVTSLDEEGSERAMMQGRHSRTEPLRPDLFVEAKKNIHSDMIAAAFQSYTEITGLAQASGEKLQLARGDFEAASTDMANEVRLLVQWVLETVLMLAQYIESAGEPTRYKISVEVSIDTGVVTADHKLILSQLRSEGFIPHQTALQEAGYNNPTALIKQIMQAKAEAQAQAVTPGAVDATGGDVGTDMDTEIDTVNDPRRVAQKARNNAP